MKLPCLARDDALIFGDLEGGYLNPDRFSRRFVRSLTLARKELSTDALPMLSSTICAIRTRRSCWRLESP
jgi:hypothetical protein